MRARMALIVSGQNVELREVALKDKPPEMIAASAKATTPTMVTPDGAVLDESLAIMQWALKCHDPQNWLTRFQEQQTALVAENDRPFKYHLDRYKYATRYPGADAIQHRTAGMAFIDDLATRLQSTAHLFGDAPVMADIAIFPFVRQFRIADPDWFDAAVDPALQRWLSDHLESALFLRSMHKTPIWRVGDPPVYLDATGVSA